MTNKEYFINEVLALTGNNPENVFSPEAFKYWTDLNVIKEKPMFTKNGKLILNCMRNNKDKFNNLFKAKDIAEVISMSSRTISGSIRKLVTDGFVEKHGENPICYSLTEKGININIEEE